MIWISISVGMEGSPYGCYDRRCGARYPPRGNKSTWVFSQATEIQPSSSPVTAGGPFNEMQA